MNRLLEIKLQGIVEENDLRNRGKKKIMRHVTDEEKKEQMTQGKCFEGDDKVNWLLVSLKMPARKMPCILFLEFAEFP